MEPCTDMNYIAEKYGKTHSFIGNADTRILLNGTKEDIYQEVKRCMDIGKNVLALLWQSEIIFLPIRRWKIVCIVMMRMKNGGKDK